MRKRERVQEPPFRGLTLGLPVSLSLSGPRLRRGPTPPPLPSAGWPPVRSGRARPALSRGYAHAVMCHGGAADGVGSSMSLAISSSKRNGLFFGEYRFTGRPPRSRRNLVKFHRMRPCGSTAPRSHAHSRLPKSPLCKTPSPSRTRECRRPLSARTSGSPRRRPMAPRRRTARRGRARSRAPVSSTYGVAQPAPGSCAR